MTLKERDFQAAQFEFLTTNRPAFFWETWVQLLRRII